MATALACASNPKAGAPGDKGTSVKGSAPVAGPDPQNDEPRHGEISFPRPEHESCTPGARTPYHLAVRVRDESGEAFPAVHVHLFPMGAGKGTLATVQTNKGGVANIVMDPPGVYAVTVAVGGFEPQVRALTLRASCSGAATFTLKVGPVVGQK